MLLLLSAGEAGGDRRAGTSPQDARPTIQQGYVSGPLVASGNVDVTVVGIHVVSVVVTVEIVGTYTVVGTYIVTVTGTSG
jgi:hypothetical protein